MVGDQIASGVTGRLYKIVGLEKWEVAMAMTCSRRTLLAGLPFVGFALTEMRARGQTPDAGVPSPSGVPAYFPATDPELGRQVVGLSHRDLDGVRRLVERCPTLACASYDWGFGDWESALGAASHTGQREIALFLMKHGARPDIFTFAMLGNLDAVRAMIQGSPGVQQITGPHGISVMRHALAGGDSSVAVVEYLRELGDADPRPENLELAAGDRDKYLGRYRLGAGETEYVDIAQSKEWLTIQRPGFSSRNLLHRGNHEFSPAGAPNVRVRMVITDGTATGIEFRDPEVYMTGQRLAGG